MPRPGDMFVLSIEGEVLLDSIFDSGDKMGLSEGKVRILIKAREPSTFEQLSMAARKYRDYHGGFRYSSPLGAVDSVLYLIDRKLIVEVG